MFGVKRQPQKVWFVTFPGAELLDLAGPWSVFGHANEIVGRKAYALTIVSPLGGNVGTRHDVVLAGTRSLRQLARLGRPDVLFVAGGSPRAPLPSAEAKFVQWLRLHHRGIPRLVSICTGAFVLGEAGLFDGHRVTTHWKFLDDLRRRFPNAKVVDDSIFVQDRELWTSAGISTGIDLSLAMVEQDCGHAVAMAVARNLLLFLRRSGHQAQFSEVLKRQDGEPPRLRDLSAFVFEHLGESLPVRRLARALGMTERTFARWCRSELHESPAALVRRLRLDEARRLLAGTDLPLKDIATRAGIGDASTLWRLFSRHLGVTPSEYRDRFASANACA